MAGGLAAVQAQPAGSPYMDRPIYSEPASGLQMPPGCVLEPAWRARLPARDYEVWVVQCDGVARSWMLRRSVIEMISATQARLRFQILDDRVWPQESAGDSLSVQCVGRGQADSGYVVAGAQWGQVSKQGGEIRLRDANIVLRASIEAQKFIPAKLSEVECTRYPQREAMMRRLQEAR